MKYLSILLLSSLVLSCTGIKKGLENQTESPKKIANPVETKLFDNDVEIQQTPEVVNSKSNTNTEVDSENKGPLKKNRVTDSLDSFHQNLTKGSLTDHQLWDELLKSHVSKYGNVDYAGFKKDYNRLQDYIRILQFSYKKINPKTVRTEKEKLAFCINTYNALTIDLILRNYPTKSIKDIKDPWDQRLWKFGDKWLNLNDIEHKILRKMNEPRIHFAIVCASISCPELQNEAFIASNLEEQLINATKEFLSDSSKNKLSEHKIKVSKIFKWFKKDFEQKGSLINFLNEYSDIKISEKAIKNYTDYNWDLND